MFEAVSFIQLSKVRSGRMGPYPRIFGLSKGHVEAKTRNGSGIRDPQFELLQIELMRTDRMTS